MFNPTRDQARLFFIDAWDKHQNHQVLTPAEAIAIEWIQLHPEYHALLGDRERALAADFSPEAGQVNPFLHLSMHLAIAEQVSIDQPNGIRAAYNALCIRVGDRHEASHHISECLAEQIWQQQRNGIAFSSERYLASIQSIMKT